MPSSHTGYPIPEEGLAEVLRGWSGKAELYAALASIADDWAEIAWQSDDIRRRADRVLYEEMLPILETWPNDVATWLDALPASSSRNRRTSTVLGAGVDWVETRNLGTWPASEYVHMERDRVPDQQLSKVARWALDKLYETRRSAIAAYVKLDLEAHRQVATALEVREMPPLVSAVGQEPSEQDVKLLGEYGAPWTTLAPFCKLLLALQSQNLMEYARRHLMPTEDLRWRLFHLGTLGVVLKSLREHGWTLVNRKPLSAALAQGPQYEATDPYGTKWDLWFESSQMWSYYGVTSAYQQLSVAAFGQGTPMGADVALVRRDVAAYLFECKYGDRRYVARHGFHQISTYAAEVLQHLAPDVTALLVGPDGVVPTLSFVDMAGARIGAAAPEHLAGFQPGSL